MAETDQQRLGRVLWNIADKLRGAMNADDFRDYMLSFLFLQYLSDNYEIAASKELGRDYPVLDTRTNEEPLAVWYKNNPDDIAEFEQQMRRKIHYVIKPQHLWSRIAELARTQSSDLLNTLQEGFRYIENESFQSTFNGLFSEINLSSDKLGRGYEDRNQKLCTVIGEIAKGLSTFSSTSDSLGDAYEFLIAQFAAGSGKKAGEFYTPQEVSDILSRIVTLDAQNPANRSRRHLNSVLDFACGSGSLLLNVRKQAGSGGVGRLYGQEKNITTYNLARMNMLLHGVKDSEFEIHHGDTLSNDWGILQEDNPSKKPQYDAVVANPPFSYRWNANESMNDDMRFKSYGVAPRTAADFAFLLHGFHYLSQDGVMAIILPHGVLFRGGVEQRIRSKMVEDGHVDAIIGLPANLFYSTGIPVCIVVLKKCKMADDILFVNASSEYIRGKKQNQLAEEHIDRIVDAYTNRKIENRYSKRVSLDRIRKENYNLSISVYISTAEPEAKIDIAETTARLADVDSSIESLTSQYNSTLERLGLGRLP